MSSPMIRPTGPRMPHSMRTACGARGKPVLHGGAIRFDGAQTYYDGHDRSPVGSAGRACTVLRTSFRHVRWSDPWALGRPRTSMAHSVPNHFLPEYQPSTAAVGRTCQSLLSAQPVHLEPPEKDLLDGDVPPKHRQPAVGDTEIKTDRPTALQYRCVSEQEIAYLTCHQRGFSIIADIDSANGSRLPYRKRPQINGNPPGSGDRNRRRGG